MTTLPTLFPKPKQCHLRDKDYFIEDRTIATEPELIDAAYTLKKWLYIRFGETFAVTTGNRGAIVLQQSRMEHEQYRLDVSEKGIFLYASSCANIFLGLGTVLQLIRSKTGELFCPHGSISDAPYKAFRGVHLYVPAKESIDAYKRLLDVLRFLKYNTLIIEVGGAMEYERTGKVNQAWETFCKMVDHEFPGGTRSVQWADRYWKDSLHTENGGGRWISKNDMRGIISYAKRLGFDVIPEIQALSHCYYLTMADRSIAEQPWDHFPDTYCPMNERSYELYFQVADEILEVFAPHTVSVGHDEVRILGECPRCKEHSGDTLLAYELNRLHDFYRKRGIRMAMWGEKLQRFTSYDGKVYGGAKIERTDRFGRKWRLPATHAAIDQIENDILILDWYHSLSASSQDCFVEREFETIYGNFDGLHFADWENRSKHVSGAEISSWCTPDEPTLGRDGILTAWAFSAALLWQSDYSESKYEQTLKHMQIILPTARALARGTAGPLMKETKSTLLYATPPEHAQITLPIRKTGCDGIDAITAGLEAFYGSPIYRENFLIRVQSTAQSLVFFHAARQSEPFEASYNFPDRNRWELGVYVIYYQDGSVQLCNISYGTTCAHIDMDWGRRRALPNERDHTIDDEAASAKRLEPSPHYTLEDPWRNAVCWSTYPIITGDHTVYAYEWINKKPDATITAIKPIHTTQKQDQNVWLFAVAALNG